MNLNMSTSGNMLESQQNMRQLLQTDSFTDLEKAEGHSMILIDANGQAVSYEKYRLARTKLSAIQLIFTVWASVMYALLLGPSVGVSFGFGMLLVFASRYLFITQLTKTATLLQEGLIDRAESKWRKLLPFAWSVPGGRAAVYQGLTSAATKRGDYISALWYNRKATSFLRKGRKGWAQRTILQCVEVTLLCNLHEFEQARTQLLAIEHVPNGDYLQLAYWSSRMYLEFCIGQQTLAEQEVWQLSQIGLRMNRGAILLSLCAWNYQQLGQETMTAHLLTEAEARLSDPRAREDLRQMMPFLWDWMGSMAAQKHR